MNKTEWQAWLNAAKKAEKGKGPAPAPLAYADVLDLFMHAQEQEERAKKAEKHLRPLVDTTKKVLKAIDAQMDLPHSQKRDKTVAELCNALDRQNEDATYFGLGIDFRTGKPYERAKRLQSRKGSPELAKALQAALAAAPSAASEE